ncbi:MAG TPA: stage III sporulation protein AG [Clostridiales bacterium]|nr:stage III sporulation protein AG [Clostridiales bacterium]
MKIYKKLQSCFDNSQYKKVIYNLATFVIIIAIFLIAWDTLMPNKTDSGNDKAVYENENIEEAKQDFQTLQEKKLENILSQIEGVGKTKVMITYETGTEVVPAFNVQNSKQVTEEKDANGGTRSTTQEDITKNIVMGNKDNEMIILKEIEPQIRGVVVVAEGAGDIEVKSKIIEAVQTVFQIPISKVTVYEKNNL